MRDIDENILKSELLSEYQEITHQFLQLLDREDIDRLIFKETGEVFQPFISIDEIMPNEQYEAMTEDDRQLLMQTYDWVMGKKKLEVRRGLKVLQKLKKKYPNLAMIYNFIGNAYLILGQNTKHYHALKETCKKFPNYIFGKISLAEYHLQQGHHDIIPEIFNHKLQLYMHHPELGAHPVFHQSEMRGFYTVMGRYYAREGKFEHAIKCYFLVADVEPHSPQLEALVKEIFVMGIEQLVSKAKKTQDKL